VPVETGLGFDFDVAVHRCLARQPQLVFMINAGKKTDGIKPEVEFFPKPRLADMLATPLDVHAARPTKTESATVRQLMNAWVDFDTRLARFLSQIGPVENFDLFLFFEKLDLGHRLLIRELPGVAMSTATFRL
jgi:hypothetical protein